MTIFEIIILVGFYIFTMIIEISFSINYYDRREMNLVDIIWCLLITILAPIFLALHLGAVIYQKLE